MSSMPARKATNAKSAPGHHPAFRPQDLARRLLEHGFAGTVPNTRAANLRAIDKLLAGEPFYTFGVRRVERALAEGMLDRDGIIRVMAKACGCRTSEEFLSEMGYIDAVTSALGLHEMARWLAQTAAKRWAVALGTGHPGSMLGCYVRLAEWLRERGCDIAEIPVGENAGVDWFADQIGGVAFTSDGCGILHGHATRVMEAVLAENEVDIVIADHGHAGAAINAGLTCLSVMDTNDPALAIASVLGASELLVVPLYDNRPNGIAVLVADWLIDMAEHILENGYYPGEANPRSRSLKFEV